MVSTRWLYQTRRCYHLSQGLKRWQEEVPDSPSSNTEVHGNGKKRGSNRGKKANNGGKEGNSLGGKKPKAYGRHLREYEPHFTTYSILLAPREEIYMATKSTVLHC
uniref:Uncharacterized protein n=1 Tax=Cannabis sativa TaxID=3483 RepID=A0A803PRF5_CANSA